MSDESHRYSTKGYHTHIQRITKLKNIISILKAVNCTIYVPLKEKLHELKQLYSQYDVHTLCEILKNFRGRFYNHLIRNRRSNTWFEKQREEYHVLIQMVFDEYRQVLGSQKIQAILVRLGYLVSTEYVDSLL